MTATPVWFKPESVSQAYLYLCACECSWYQILLLHVLSFSSLYESGVNWVQRLESFIAIYIKIIVLDNEVFGSWDKSVPSQLNIFFPATKQTGNTLCKIWNSAKVIRCDLSTNLRKCIWNIVCIQHKVGQSSHQKLLSWEVMHVSFTKSLLF